MSILRLFRAGGIVVALGGTVGGATHFMRRVHTRTTVRVPVYVSRHTSTRSQTSRVAGSPVSSGSSWGTTPALSAGSSDPFRFESSSGSTTRLPAVPYGGEGAVAAFPYASGIPVARFSVSTPVRPGAPVTFVNESYDTTSGVSITSLTWSGRQSSYSTVGVHSVTLVARDSLGRVSAPYTAYVVVTNPRPPLDTPIAYFVVTSPVSIDSPVTYTNESYDPQGEALVNQIWTGRNASFDTPGTYPVSLRVVNRTGTWSRVFTRDVVVTEASPYEPVVTREPSPTNPVSEPSPTSFPSQVSQTGNPTWSLTASPDPAAPGQLVTLTATASLPVEAGSPILEVPAPLTGTWGGISYAQTNASGAMTAIDRQTFQRSLTVPVSTSFPSGNYRFEALLPNASPVWATLTVRKEAASAAMTYEEPIISGN